jgi:asparagine synthase (glutamine-hydrolysing)
MTAALTHRGPDERGSIVLRDAGLAMTRLSIIDLASGTQPIANEDGSRWVVQNGEIYNFAELRARLQTTGHRFRTRSDTEAIVHAHEEWGDACVDRLRGMFAFAVLQGTPGGAARGLFVARDRVGKKPLYYYGDADRFLFASEIKALLAHPAVPRRVNRDVIPLYLAHGYVPAPWTMYEGIHELFPGHTLAVRGEQVTIRPYWEFPAAGQEAAGLSEQEIVEHLRHLLEEAVRVRLVSDVPLGAFLSGGLDSSAVVALMARHTSRPVKTFSIGFADEPSFNELGSARRVAKALGTDHHEFVVRPDAFELLEKLVWHYDQPFADSSAIPTFLVAKLAREHVTVALSGDGGDELFAGYERFAAARLAEIYRRTPQVVQRTLGRAVRLLPQSTAYDGLVRRAGRFLQAAPLPLPERYLQWVGVFYNGYISNLLAEGEAVDPVRHFTAYFDGAPAGDLVDRLLYVNARSYLPGDLLVKTDRMSMANGLETRCPLLDQELIEFAAGIPSRLKLHGLTTKYVLKRALGGLVPDDIIARKKHGFGAPVGAWFRGSLAGPVRELLLGHRARRRDYFRPEMVRRLVEEHQTGRIDHGHRLWTLATFEMWHRVFIDDASPPAHAPTHGLGVDGLR